MIYLKDYTKLNNEEHKSLLELRNQEYVREVSLNQEKIAFKDHLKWVENLKTDDSKEYYAVFEDKKLLGAINIFDKDAQIKWGVFFDEKTSLLIKSIVPLYFLEYIFENYNPEFLYLEVKQTNTNAINFDKGLGFCFSSQKEDIVTMKMNKQQFEEAKTNSFLKRIVKKMDKYQFVMERK